MTKKSQVLALLELGWSYRRIEAETGLRRETVSRDDRTRRSNAAKTFAGSAPRPRFAAALYRSAITEKLDAELSLQRIWQDLEARLPPQAIHPVDAEGVALALEDDPDGAIAVTADTWAASVFMGGTTPASRAMSVET